VDSTAKLFVYKLRPVPMPGRTFITTRAMPHPVMRADSPEEAIELACRALPLADGWQYVVEDVRN
jgi:hypothetical protein